MSAFAMKRPMKVNLDLILATTEALALRPIGDGKRPWGEWMYFTPACLPVWKIERKHEIKENDCISSVWKTKKGVSLYYFTELTPFSILTII